MRTISVRGECNRQSDQNIIKTRGLVYCMTVKRVMMMGHNVAFSHAYFPRVTLPQSQKRTNI